MDYLRDHVQFPVSDDYFERRRAEGWKLRVIEWEKSDLAERPDRVAAAESVPYGLEVVAGTLHLTENLGEKAVLLTILQMIVKDKSVPLIADELNRRHLKNRAGGNWTAPAVFDLLPRVIEMGPALLQSEEWIALRPTMAASQGD